MRLNLTICLAIAIFLVSNCDADTPALPKDVPPVIGMAVMKDSKVLELTVPKIHWSVVGEEKPKQEWPRFGVDVKEEVLVLEMVYDPATQLAEKAQNRLVNLQGRRLSHEEAGKRLAQKTAVLVSVSGAMPDAFYLQFTKPETLIVLLGHSASPAPKLLPQPKR